VDLGPVSRHSDNFNIGIGIVLSEARAYEHAPINKYITPEEIAEASVRILDLANRLGLHPIGAVVVLPVLAVF
jgi:hypothetical protein